MGEYVNKQKLSEMGEYVNKQICMYVLKTDNYILKYVLRNFFTMFYVKQQNFA